MTDNHPTLLPLAAGTNATAGCGCGSSAATSDVPAPVAAAVCCGTVEAAKAAESCCDPGAKADAVAAGAGCCG